MFTNNETVKQDLIQVALPFISELGDMRKRELVEAVVASFDHFKAAQTDPDGTVEINRFSGGLLSEIASPSRRAPASEVEAWQCAGPAIFDDVGLAYHLWLGKNAEFGEVLLRYGFATTFAAIMVWSAKKASIGSLAQVGGLLAHFAHGESKFWKDEHAKAIKKLKRSGDLSKGPDAAAIRRSINAVERLEKARGEFGPWFRENPPITVKDAAGRAEKLLAKPGHSLHGQYTYQTLHDKILPKIRKEVLLELLLQSR